jgi:hypothetical protein
VRSTEASRLRYVTDSSVWISVHKGLILEPIFGLEWELLAPDIILEELNEPSGQRPKDAWSKTGNTDWSACCQASPAIRRLGFTCTARKRCQPATFRREAIVHELLHLKIPSHGPLFKVMLRAYLGVADNG